jgi:IclR family transcriptional regulator, blcABC operon repressor
MLNRMTRKDWSITPSSPTVAPSRPAVIPASILRKSRVADTGAISPILAKEPIEKGPLKSPEIIRPATSLRSAQATAKASNSEPGGFPLVPAVEKAVALLDVLAEVEESLALADLQRRTGLPKSSLHGILSTLTHLGLIYRNDEQRYSLGSKCLQWADAYAHQTRVVLAFNEATKSLAALQEETVMLAILEKAKVRYLGCREGTRPLAVKFRVGGSFPAACTSTGKAILATLSNDKVRALVAEHGLERQTRYSVANLDALIKQLDRFRHAGYAVDDEEMAEGMHCFGAPIFTAGKSEAIAAVAVSLIKASTPVKRKQEVIQQIGELAKDISRRLGALA